MWPFTKKNKGAYQAKAQALVSHARAAAIATAQSLERSFPQFQSIQKCGLDPSWLATFSVGSVGAAYMSIADNIPERYWNEVHDAIHAELEDWHPRLSDELLPFLLTVAEKDIQEKDLSPDLVFGRWLWEIIGLTDEADETVASMACDPEWHQRVGHMMIAATHGYWREAAN